MKRLIIAALIFLNVFYGVMASQDVYYIVIFQHDGVPLPSLNYSYGTVFFGNDQDDKLASFNLSGAGTNAFVFGKNVNENFDNYAVKPNKVMINIFLDADINGTISRISYFAGNSQTCINDLRKSAYSAVYRRPEVPGSPFGAVNCTKGSGKYVSPVFLEGETNRTFVVEVPYVSNFSLEEAAVRLNLSDKVHFDESWRTMVLVADNETQVYVDAHYDEASNSYVAVSPQFNQVREYDLVALDAKRGLEQIRLTVHPRTTIVRPESEESEEPAKQGFLSFDLIISGAIIMTGVAIFLFLKRNILKAGKD